MVDASPRTPRILKQTRCDSLRRLIMLICYVWSPFKSSQMHHSIREQRKIAIYFNKKWTKSQLQKTFAIRLYIYEPIVETYIHCGISSNLPSMQISEGGSQIFVSFSPVISPIEFCFMKWNFKEKAW